ncbi:MAG: DUF4124 domain-containing protein, partial [Deltaproteobacteria bacterium]|nr:DUF4124 domain-containing protein [Deltaproteobacteria bacterium]
MKKVILFLAFAVLSVPRVWADLYLWDDEQGVLHIVDDLYKVPEAYRDKVRTIETKPAPPSPPPITIIPVQPLVVNPMDEIFGDYPLSWWKKTIDLKKQELNEARRAYKEKKDFVGMYEQGRRLGQIYETDQIERYERFKAELTPDEKR